MNATLELITVTLTPTVPTPRARSTARVMQDTLETESRVLVSNNDLKFEHDILIQIKPTSK